MSRSSPDLNKRLIGGGDMINYANYFGGPTFFLHLEWGGPPQNW